MALALIATRSFAADPVGDRRAAAEQLFLEGRKDVERGAVDEGCSKLARSQSLDPSAGTLLNLADCYERQGKIATAWSSFREAARAASDRKRADWEELAEARARALEPRLSKIVVVVSADAPRDLRVIVDDVELPREAFGAAVPREVGSHRIEATASGYLSWKSEVALGERAIVRVQVPALTPAPSTPRSDLSSNDAAPNDRGAQWMKPAGVVSLAVGGASMLTGGVFALLSKGALDDARASCPTYPRFDATQCAASTREDNDAARRNAAISSATLIGGAVLVGAGVVLLLNAPSPRRYVLAPSIGREHAGMQLTAPF